MDYLKGYLWYLSILCKFSINPNHEIIYNLLGVTKTHVKFKRRCGKGGEWESSFWMLSFIIEFFIFINIID